MLERIVKNGDFSEYDNSKDCTLIRIDRNNTHFYTYHRCEKCGGTGNIFYYAHVKGGVCFRCGGTGRYDRKLVVRTEEYAHILEQKRFERNCAKAKLQNIEFLKAEGFSPDGKTYLVLGNTYAIKDQLKRDGAVFNRHLGWHFSHEVEGYPLYEVSVDTVIAEYDEPIHLLNKDVFGQYKFHEELYYEVERFVKAANDEYFRSIAPETHWFGDVGKRYTVEATSFMMLGQWEGTYGTRYMYKFTDVEGNIFVWKTGNLIDTEKPVTVTGTVKAHSEYKGEKQTELTRCKIA